MKPTLNAFPTSGRLTLALAALLVFGTGCFFTYVSPDGADAARQAGRASEEGWSSDRDDLVRALEKYHPNPWHAVSRQAFRAALDAPIAPGDSEATADARLARLAQALALIREGHTALQHDLFPGRTLPLRVARFDEGYFVVGAYVDPVTRAGPSLELLGGRLLRIGGVELADLVSRLGRFVPAETPGWAAEQLTDALTTGAFLSEAGVASSAAGVSLEVDKGGLRVERTLDYWPGGERGRRLLLRRGPFEFGGSKPAQSLAAAGVPYWFEVLPGALYFQYNRCVEDPGKGFADFADELFAAVEAQRPERIVVDLRNNSGGNSGLFTRRILPRLRAWSLAHPGGLVGLIGPRVFSSGVFAAAELRRDAGAALLGEPAGQSGEHYGYVRQLRLAQTGLWVHLSTRFFRLGLQAQDAALEPDLALPNSAGAFFAGEDPAVALALGYRRATSRALEAGQP